MAGIIHVDDARVEATSGQMLIAFGSGGDQFRFHLPPHVALRFRERIMRDGWEVLCAPDAEVVPFPAKPKRRRKAKG